MAKKPKKKRNKRRRARKDPLQTLQQFSENLQESQRKVTLEMVEQNSTAPGMALTGLAAGRAHEEAAGRLLEDFQPRLMCQKGCVYCCYAPVSVTVPEAVNVAAYLMTHKEPQEQKVIWERLHHTYLHSHQMSSEQRHATSFPCPLLDLETAECSVYPVRPLVCRGRNSRNVSACEKKCSSPQEAPAVPAFAPMLLAAYALREGVRLGLEQAGVQAPLLDLTRALFRLLSGSLEHTVAAWLEGAPVFEGAEAFTEPD